MFDALFAPRIKKVIWGVVALAIISGAAPAFAFQIKVSSASAQVLQELDARMSEVASEFRFNCSIRDGHGYCQTLAQPVGAAPIVQELIAHPFVEDSWIAYRITRGSAEFRESFYRALEGFSETHQLPENVRERRLKLEGELFSIRCIEGATEKVSMGHHCWVIVGASLFNQVIED